MRGARGSASGLSAVQVRPRPVAPACALAAVRTRAGLALALARFRSGGKPQRGPRSPRPGCGSRPPRSRRPLGADADPQGVLLCAGGSASPGSERVCLRCSTLRCSRGRGRWGLLTLEVQRPEPAARKGPHFRKAPHPRGPETGSALGVTSRPSGPGPLPEPASLGALGPLSSVHVLQRRALSFPR